MAKQAKERTPSWRARRLPGGIFCAPACGGRCTVAMHDAAMARARKIAKEMGNGWKPVVFENLGWHARAISPCGRVKISWDGLGRSFIAFIGRADFCGGTWSAVADTAFGAFTAALAQARLDVARLSAMIDGL